ncbi:hypothetical protein IMSHALPRED_009927 [Imshaugia aleurites]|uniref:Uncharacterized protein n=1 Tax=Imshaugia aleurites TaxID=172621 RepID=A0A8H3IAF7_9LECA|nr:hypothetical protein IMSHALPRED_009927 [Imshaugia aleurites]
MSAFEKLPREVRDMIYGYCLIHDGEIIPYPNIDERRVIEKDGGEAAKRCTGRRGVECNDKQILRSCGGITYATDWPSVALLGVNKNIQEEAASVLFGKNVRRISYVEHWEMGEEKDLWYTYRTHFRHISTHMSMNDADDVLRDIKRTRATAKALNWSRDRLRSEIHAQNLRWLAHTFEFRYELLVMMKLKSLVFDVENLFCPMGCCRERALHSFCKEMRDDGPWYRKQNHEKTGRNGETTTQSLISDLEAKFKTDVKVVGLEDDTEKDIFMHHWRLYVK